MARVTASAWCRPPPYSPHPSQSQRQKNWPSSDSCRRIRSGGPASCLAAARMAGIATGGGGPAGRRGSPPTIWASTLLVDTTVPPYSISFCQFKSLSRAFRGVSGINVALRSKRIVETVSSGVAELNPDADRPESFTLLLDGAPQSHVDLRDPTHLEFEYVRRMAAAIDLIAPPGQALRTLHLGGGALTLPRYVAATRPGSAQRVVEIDGALVEFVRR